MESADGSPLVIRGADGVPLMVITECHRVPEMAPVMALTRTHSFTHTHSHSLSLYRAGAC
jgi:hypothetical protein